MKQFWSHAGHLTEKIRKKAFDLNFWPWIFNVDHSPITNNVRDLLLDKAIEEVYSYNMYVGTVEETTVRNTSYPGLAPNPNISLVLLPTTLKNPFLPLTISQKKNFSI
jgi:hypothetical protein